MRGNPHKPSVAIISPRHRYDDVRIASKQGRTLIEHGFDVSLIVRADSATRYLGMRVVTVDAPFGGLFRFLGNLPYLLRQALRVRADVYILHNPDTILLGLLLIACRKKVIYDTHEDFSRRIFIYPLIPTALKPIFGWSITFLESILAKIGAGFIVTQPKQLGRFGNRPILLDNAPLTRGPIIEKSRKIAAELEHSDQQIDLVYAGILTEARCAELMLDLIVELNKQLPARLVLVGWFVDPALEAKAMAHKGWKHVTFTGRVNHATALAHIQKADIGLALLSPTADIPDTGITKIFEYMFFGIPFVASDFSRWRELAGQKPVGIFVEPINAKSIATKIRDLYQNPGRMALLSSNGTERIRDFYNWESESAAFVSLVSTAAATKRSDTSKSSRPLKDLHPAKAKNETVLWEKDDSRISTHVGEESHSRSDYR